MAAIEIAATVIKKPNNSQSIKDKAAELLKSSKVVGQYPTPLEVVAESLNLSETNDLFENVEAKTFLSSLPQNLIQSFYSAQQKIRGMADLKKPLIFVAQDNNKNRENWARAHEIGHKALDWHNLDYIHLDNEISLSSSCEELFDIEANHFASEIIFQGNNFKDISNQYRPEFNNIFSLSNMHGVSRHATSRKFVEDNEEPIALITYSKSPNFFPQNESSLFILGKSHSASKTFLKNYCDVLVPEILPSNHDWLSAYNLRDVQDGEISLSSTNGQRHSFLWEAWWNTYTLLILIRKAPKLRIVRSLLRRP